MLIVVLDRQPLPLHPSGIRAPVPPTVFCVP